MSISQAYTLDELSAFLSEAPQLTVVKFGAKWCLPCQQFNPYFESLAFELHSSKWNVKFVCVDKQDDTDDTDDIFDFYKITKLPTVLCIKDNDVKCRIVRPDATEFRYQVVPFLPPRVLTFDEDF